MELFKKLRLIGPGFVVAATGLGAGDLVAAAVSGASLGGQIIWAVVFGALIKFALNEGLARWQLSTGDSVLQGWQAHLPRWVNAYFLIYLFLWAFLVGAALMAACGLAANALLPQLSITSWAVLHSLLAVLLVLFGRYSVFESAMKVLILLMFVTVMAALASLDLSGINLRQTFFIDDAVHSHGNMVLAVIGGVGGSVTLLCYGYWMREKGWQTSTALPLARVDLIVAYTITALFGIGTMLLAAKAAPATVQGNQILIAMADELGRTLSPMFREVFLLGVWAAVFSSMLGVWQGVPYLFADILAARNKAESHSAATDKKSWAYRSFLGYLALPPMLLLLLGKPVWLVMLYAVTGAFFMPFLALTLLYLNNRIIAKTQRFGIASNILIALALIVFGFLSLQSLFN
ncbi:Nramp family divalent metal transporter [Zhongshania sp.]|uniref:Nramp family divalent metal transporter n=1 Tax=Zhongshania sp. TaxID=1971902 RepID=UPI0035628424